VLGSGLKSSELRGALVGPPRRVDRADSLGRLKALRQPADDVRSTKFQGRNSDMQVSAVTQAAHASQATVAALSPAQVSAAILKRANGDGDGRTGSAALNDGDAAARAAASQVAASRHSVDVRV
jgi:hypothetical protein